jgi:hypothetical protein
VTVQPAEPRPKPPMFATAIGEGSSCAYCASNKRVTIKLLLPGGYQVCPVCDA